jgi:hypothetical protein
MFVSDPASPLVALARSEFEMQAAQNNNYDLIGLGVATFALALGGIDVALKGGLGQLWFLPWVPIAAAIVLSIGALGRREVMIGLDVWRMAETYAGATEADINLLLLGTLSDAVRQNREPLRRRGLGITWAYIVLVVGLPIAAAIMLVAG